MAMTKKPVKAKEPVRIRFKKLANGNQSIYLDSYKDGKREYKFLKLYLVPERDDESRAANANALQAANAAKAQLILDITNSRAGLKSAVRRSKMLLLDWIKIYREEQEKRGVRRLEYLNELILILREYRGEEITMADIDQEFCKGFIDFLLNRYTLKRSGGRLKRSSARLSCDKLNAILNAAVRADVIEVNPFSKLSSADKIKVPPSQKVYLTIDEVGRLVETPCRKEDIKRAFLFGCFCGLRISDIRALTWKNIIRDGEKYRIEIVVQKTQRPLYLPLSSEALKWLPERNGKSDEEKVFTLPLLSTIDRDLKKWVAKAGINKTVTFHTSRHTYATMLLTMGGDLYAVSKMLGHSNIGTTQIYAKIVNQKLEATADLLDGVFDQMKK